MAEHTHTPGEMTVEPDSETLTVDGLTIATMYAPGLLEEAEQLANMRRLAQCWNAHDALVTALAELRDWYTKYTGLPACKANHALKVAETCAGPNVGVW
ncbi:MAG: hypothetical protein GY851_35420 [bacterium]|nr:hypothetical protein [bacterium]